MFNQSQDKEEPDMFAAVGNQSPIKAKDVPVSYNGEIKKVKLERIMEDNNIQVTMGTWLGMSKMGSETKLLELTKAGLIDPQTALEFYNAPNIPRVMDRLMKKKSEEALLQAAVGQAPGTVPAIDMMGGQGAPGGVPQGMPMGAPPPGKQPLPAGAQ